MIHLEGASSFQSSSQARFSEISYPIRLCLVADYIFRFCMNIVPSIGIITLGARRVTNTPNFRSG